MVKEQDPAALISPLLMGLKGEFHQEEAFEWMCFCHCFPMIQDSFSVFINSEYITLREISGSFPAAVGC